MTAVQPAEAFFWFLLVSHLINSGYWSYKFLKLGYYETSCEENGDNVLNPCIESALDTEGYISCSRMLRPCDGCLDQGFDPILEEMELPGILHSVDGGEISHVVTGLDCIPMKMKFDLLFFTKAKRNRSR